jgi:phenylpyruvate tautomerase PptA (4-oxalocrotonate tautomerase family)
VLKIIEQSVQENQCLYGPRLDVKVREFVGSGQLGSQALNRRRQRSIVETNPRIEPSQLEDFLSIPEEPFLVDKCNPVQATARNFDFCFNGAAGPNECESCGPVQRAIDPSTIKCAMACNNALLEIEESVSILPVAPIDRSPAAPLDPLDRHSWPRQCLLLNERRADIPEKFMFRRPVCERIVRLTNAAPRCVCHAGPHKATLADKRPAYNICGEDPMPIMICETAQRLESATRKTLAKSITESVHDVIGSDLNLISVVFHEVGQDQIWLAGQPSQDVLILCYIRAGRPMALKTQLALRVSAAWHEVVGTPEDAIEVAVIEAPAAQTARGGQRLPEPPHSSTAAVA